MDKSPYFVLASELTGAKILRLASIKLQLSIGHLVRQVKIFNQVNMKLLAVIAVASTLFSSVSAHYRFTSLIAGGKTTGAYEYVRQNSNMNSPVLDVTSTDIRCNVGAGSNGASIKTYNVTSGSTVGFAMDQGIFHAGPLSVYLGKAPSTAASWDGSGANWFKIYEIGAQITSSAINFPANGQSQFSFPIPAATPAGEYLLRIEHIGLHSTGQPQFYISCAQVKITSGGSGNPPKVSIPGYIAQNDPSIILNIYYPIPTSYTVPGPAVWHG
jgi:hypothetical protein